MLLSATQKAGDLVFTVFNTGEGIQYHSQPPPPKRNQANTCSHYRIPASQRQAFYADTLQALFEPLILGGLEGVNTPMYMNARYSAEELYLMLEPYRQTVVKGEWMKKEQQSGTCSFQCMLAFTGKTAPGLEKELKFLWEQEAATLLLEYKDLFLKMDPLYEVYLNRLNLSLFRHLEKLQKGGLAEEKSIALLDRFERQKKEIEALAKQVQESNPSLPLDAQPHWTDPDIELQMATLKKTFLNSYAAEENTKIREEGKKDKKIEQIKQEKAYPSPLFASSLNQLETAEIIALLQERNRFYEEKERMEGQGWSSLSHNIPRDFFFIENCRQISLFFIDPIYNKQKTSFLEKLKNQPTLLNQLIEELSILIEKAGNNALFSIDLSHLLALEGLRLAIFDLGVLQDDQLGYLGAQRLDHYALQFSLSLESLMLTSFTFHSPQAEKEMEKIKQAYQERFSEQKERLCHLNRINLQAGYFRFNYQLTPDFQYASHFVSTLSPEELEKAHQDYLQEFIKNQSSTQIKEENWLIYWILTHQKLPRAYQTLFNTSLILYFHSPLSDLVPVSLNEMHIEIIPNYSITRTKEGELWISIFNSYSFKASALHLRNSKALIPEESKVDYTKDSSSHQMPVYSFPQNEGICQFRSQYKEIIAMTSLSHPVHLTMLLDYYRQSPELLGQSEHQVFFESILFPPHKLTQALKKNPFLREELLHFFEEMKKQILSKSLKFANKKEISFLQTFLLEQKVRIYQAQALEDAKAAKGLIETRKEIEAFLEKEGEEQEFEIKGRLLFALIGTCGPSALEKIKCADSLFHFQKAMQSLMISDQPKKIGLASYFRAARTLLDHLREIMDFIQSEESRSWIESLVPGQQVLSWKMIDFPLLSIQTEKGPQLFHLFSGENLSDPTQLGLVPEWFLSSKKYQLLFGQKRVPAEKQGDRFYRVQNQGGEYKIWFSSDFFHRDSLENIEKTIEGKRHFLLSPEEIHLDFLPVAQEWQLWLNIEKNSSTILIYDKTGKQHLGSILEKGVIELEHLTSCHFRYANSNEWASPFIHLAKPFLISERKDKDKGSGEEIRLNLKDEKGETLEWVKKKNHWHLKQEPSYFIAQDQKIVGIKFHQRYLILENNRGEKWALLPELSHTQLMDRDLSSPQEAPFSCLMIALSKEQEITVQTSPYKNSFLAYHLLMQAKKPQDYLVVLHYLQGTQEFRPYEDKELKMLGLIVFSDKEKKNDDPEAFAIRLYAAYLLYDNLTHYPREKNQSADLKAIQPPEANDSPLVWSQYVQYVQRNFPNTLGEEHLRNIVSSYLKKQNQLSNELKIEKLLPHDDLERWGFLSLSSQASQHSQIPLPPTHPLPLVHFLRYQEVTKYLTSNFYHSEDLPPFSTRSGEKFRHYFPSLYQLACSPDPKKRYLVSNFLEKARFEACEENKQFFAVLRIALEAHDPQSPAHLAANNCLEKLKAVSTSKLHVYSHEFHENQETLNEAYATFRNIYLKTEKSQEHVDFSSLAGLILALSKENNAILELPQSPPLLSLTYSIDPKLFHSFQTIAEKYFKKGEEGQEQPKELFEGKDEIIQELNEEYVAGYQQNLSKKAVKTKQDPLEVKQKLVGEERDFLKLQKEEDEKTLQTLSQKIIQTGNKTLKQSIKERTKIGNAKRKLLTLDALLLLALKNNPKKIKQVTGLKEEEQRELLQSIGRYLEIEMRLRHTKTLLSSLEELEKTEAAFLPLQLRAIQDLLETPYSLVHHSNPLVQLTFQHFIDLNFYPDQVAGLDQMIDSTKDHFLQRATGAGKTLVFAHSLAYYKADGYHLSIHVSPTYQFASQIYEMSDRSKKALGQKGRALVFYDRPEYFNVSYLQQLNQEIIQAIRAGDYFNTTIITLRTLRAAYIHSALEYYHPSTTLTEEQKSALALKKEWVCQVNEKIRFRGRLTFDEVQDAQNPKFTLNKGVGESTYLDHVHIEMMCLMLKLGMEQQKGEGGPLIDLKGNRQAQTTEEEKTILSEKIVTSLTGNKEWLKKWECASLSSEELKELRQFLLQKNTPLPIWLEKRMEKFSRSGNQMTGLDHLLLCRQLIAGGWLFDSFAKSVYEHHGVVYQENRLPLSIPFTANMKPSKNSEFSDPYRMGLNTLIAYHVQGLNEEQIKDLIDSLRKAALKEFEEKSEVQLDFRLDETKGWSQFAKWVESIDPTLSLFDCDLKDRSLVLKLQKALNCYDPILIDLLSEYVAAKVLKKKALLTEQVSCHAMNTATMGKSISGFSATIDDSSLAPVMDYQGRKVAVSKEKGIFGQRIDLLIQRHSSVYVMGNEPQDLFRDVYRKLPEKKRKNIRALIDAGCHFRGISNEEVAKWMCIEMKEVPIKGVIFYDLETDRPYFMLKKNPAVIKPVPSFKTKIVNQVLFFEDLNLPVDQVAVYFNQDKTTGTNIPLMKNAIAISTVTADTKFFSKIQGDGRLRQIEKYQEVITAVQKAALIPMSHALEKPEIKGLSEGFVPDSHFIREVILYTYCLRAAERKEENEIFCLQNLQNTVQQYLLDKIYEDRKREPAIFIHCGHLFKETIGIDFVRDHGLPKIRTEKKAYLDLVIDKLLAPLKAIDLPPEECKTLKETLQAIKKGFLVSVDRFVWTSPSTLDPHEPFRFSQMSDGTRLQVQEKQKVKVLDKLQVKEWIQEDVGSYLTAAPSFPLTKETLYSPEFGMHLATIHSQEGFERKEKIDYGQTIREIFEKIQPFLSPESLASIEEKVKEKNLNSMADLTAEKFKICIDIIAFCCKGEEKATWEALITPYNKLFSFFNFKLFNLDEVLENKFPQMWQSKLFSPHLFVTPNFLETAENGMNLQDELQKPIFQVLVLQDENPKQTRALILSSLDAESIAKGFETPEPLPKGRKMWLLRPQGDLAWPGPTPYHKPSLLQDQEIRRLLTQVLFFAGHLSLLDQSFWQQALKEWLGTIENPAFARSFFENSVLRNRPKEEYLFSKTGKLLRGLLAL